MEVLGIDLEQLLQDVNLETIINTFTYGFDYLVVVAVYVFCALALYTIARRRKFDRPWMAWIPVAREWLLGSLSDQYQLRVQRRVTHRRKWLLGMQVILVSGVVMTVVQLLLVVWNVLDAGYNNYAGEYDLLKVWGSIGAVLLLWLVLIAVEIARTVLFHMSLYDIYRSCDPKNATLFTVLGIFFGFLQPIFLMICKDKDEGMYAPKMPREPWETEM